MHVVAAAQLQLEGVRGVRHQPWSGIPVKVYAAEAGRQRDAAAAFAAAAAEARAVRLVEVALLVGAVARLLPPRLYAAVACVAVTVFAAGLARVVEHWS
jgi:hypothetical protein